MALSTKQLTKQAVVCAVYVALTLLLSFMAYGGIQLRIAEALLLLCFYKRSYTLGLTLGCIIVNLFSPLGAIDVICGGLATLIACILISISPNIYLASVFPALVNGIIVGAELWWAYKLPFPIAFLQVSAGELISVTVLGVILFKSFEGSNRLMKLIKE